MSGVVLRTAPQVAAQRVSDPQAAARIHASIAGVATAEVVFGTRARR